MKDSKALQSEEWHKIILECRGLGLKMGCLVLCRGTGSQYIKVSAQSWAFGLRKLSLITLSCEIMELNLILELTCPGITMQGSKNR